MYVHIIIIHMVVLTGKSPNYYRVVCVAHKTNTSGVCLTSGAHIVFTLPPSIYHEFVYRLPRSLGASSFDTFALPIARMCGMGVAV